MELKSDFEVSVGVDRAWEVLTNPELIAPCLPGARLDEVEGDEFRGAVKVRVGPISAEYRGKATMVELNRDDLRIVIRAEGRDTRGAGNAAADITALMEAASENSTRVEVTIDLKISGKVAQFGRGVLGDVSAKLMGKFVDNLEAMVGESAEAEAGDGSADDEGGGESAEAEAAAQRRHLLRRRRHLLSRRRWICWGPCRGSSGSFLRSSLRCWPSDSCSSGWWTASLRRRRSVGAAPTRTWSR